MSLMRAALAGLLVIAFLMTHAACSRRPVADSSKVAEPLTTSVADSDPPPVVPAGTRPATEGRKPREVAPPQDVNPLNFEVTALEMLYQFQVTRAQLEHLAKLAPATASAARPALPVEVSPEYLAALKELHAALADNDDDRIARASSAIEKIRTAESPDFDEVEITPGARKHTAEFLRTLSAHQVASYLVDYADEFPVPRQKVVDALDVVRKAAGREWEERRDEVAGQVGWLVGGLDVAAEEKVSRAVAQLLNRVHAMKDGEFTTARPDLEKAIDGIVAPAGPTDVIRHFVERSLAELLSNPRLAAAVKLRLEDED
jgi:hypothetical protein